MNNKKYKCSKTKLTAEWLTQEYSDCYTCSNCKHTESHGYPTRPVNLGRYCSCCGLKMTNPRYIGVEFDY